MFIYLDKAYSTNRDFSGSLEKKAYLIIMDDTNNMTDGSLK